MPTYRTPADILKSYIPKVADLKSGAAAEALMENAIVQLHAIGKDFDEIAEYIGCSREMAAKAYRKGMAAVRKDTRQNAANLIQRDITRLEMMLEGSFAAACGGDKDAVKNVLSLMQHGAKLKGLEAAVKIQMEQPATAKKANIDALDDQQLETYLALSDIMEAGTENDEED